jgi:hypothetical protein
LVEQCISAAAACTVALAPTARGDEVILAIGAPGEEAYGGEFAAVEASWKAAADRAGAGFLTVGGEGSKAALEAAVRDGAKADGGGWLWVVLSGHGSFDGRESKFNLSGEDVSSAEMARWLEGSERGVVLVVAAAASAPFVTSCSGPNRIVLTATKHPSEVSYAHFGKHFAAAIGDLAAADLDLDGGVSLLEGFLVASRRVSDFYGSEGRVASEEAILDDNGDGKGTPAKLFDGVRPTTAPEGDRLPDGVRAHQVALLKEPSEAARPAEWLQRRDALELEVYRLRERRAELGDDAYFAALEPLALEIARLYEPAGAAPAPGEAASGEAGPDTSSGTLADPPSRPDGP